MRITAILLLPYSVAGHAEMYEPPSRSTGGVAVGTPNCAGGSCLWFNNGCFIGCPSCTGTDDVSKEECPNPAFPTIPLGHPWFGTIFYDPILYCLENPADCQKAKDVGFFNDIHRNPWRAPGTAPVYNPCGVNGGGYVNGPHGTGGRAFFGFQQGWKGTEVSPLLRQTTWIAGSTVEVAFGLTANHGGGYQYRICRLNKQSWNITDQATEECFQKTPLDFVGDKQWLQWGNGLDKTNRTEINAVRVNWWHGVDVLPKGSTWTRNPVPPCNDIPRLGGHNHKCNGPAFTPPAPGVYGFGPGSCASGEEPCTLEEMQAREEMFTMGVVDLVKVPDVPPGDYVLSWRWDVEQLPQVWSNCADVKIKAKDTAKPTKSFSSWSGCEACCDTINHSPCANCTKCANDKTGDCAYCWNPLEGFLFGAIPQYQCLGYEGPDGGPGVWQTGDPFIGVKWSPGCPKCWATADSCKSSDRDVEETIQLV